MGEVHLEIVAVGPAALDDPTVLVDQVLDRRSIRERSAEPEQCHQVEDLAVGQGHRGPRVPPAMHQSAVNDLWVNPWVHDKQVYLKTRHVDPTIG